MIEWVASGGRARKGLSEEVTGERVFQTEVPASAKVLRQHQGWLLSENRSKVRETQG